LHHFITRGRVLTPMTTRFPDWNVTSASRRNRFRWRFAVLVAPLGPTTQLACSDGRETSVLTSSDGSGASGASGGATVGVGGGTGGASPSSVSSSSSTGGSGGGGAPPTCPNVGGGVGGSADWDVDVDASGNVVLGGSFYGSLDLGGGAVTSAGF